MDGMLEGASRSTIPAAQLGSWSWRTVPFARTIEPYIQIAERILLPLAALLLRVVLP